jgi:glucose-1-phosphate adenylyltransferase
VVRRGARVQRAVLDTHVEVGEGARVGGDGDAALCVVGRRARVEAGAELAPGAEVDAADGADLGSGVRGGVRA